VIAVSGRDDCIDRTARAKVTTSTRLAPVRRSADAAADAVAPVV
jgi:hypothetical protein